MSPHTIMEHKGGGLIGGQRYGSPKMECGSNSWWYKRLKTKTSDRGYVAKSQELVARIIQYFQPFTMVVIWINIIITSILSVLLLPPATM